MNWKLAFSLLTFILNCIYAIPKNKTFIKNYSTLNENINVTRLTKLNKRTMTDNDEDSNLYKKQLFLSHAKKTRKLTTGDTFTPQEMLPIATKLLQKVDEPGNGKGFVSSTKHPQELADKLFEAFFMTTKRIVILKDADISGIDALQALALSGEIADEIQEEIEPEALPTVYLRGQLVKINDKPKKSKYTLVTKSVGGEFNEAERRGIPLAKKLRKERHLIINKRRRNENKEKKNVENDNKDVRQEKVNKSYKRKEQPTKRSQKDPAKCRWRYICESATDLDSCRLHTYCAKENSKVTIDDIAVEHKKDEHTLSIIQFRKMLGLSMVDEEVEKILESRNLHLNPVNKDAINKVESLSEYFNNIIVLNNFDSITAKSIGMYADTHMNEHSDKKESIEVALDSQKKF